MGEWLRSPYETAVRYGKKRDFEWIGYATSCMGLNAAMRMWS